MILGNGAMSMMHYRVSTKRAPSVYGSKRSAPVEYLTDLPCSSLLPANADVAAMLPNLTPSEILQAFVPGDSDIREGDLLVFNDVDYPVRSCGDWSFRNNKLKLLLIEQAKVT